MNQQMSAQGEHPCLPKSSCWGHCCHGGRPYPFGQHKPWSPRGTSFRLFGQMEEWLYFLNVMRPLQAMTISVLLADVTERVLQFTYLLDYHCDLTPSRSFFAELHQCGAAITDHKEEHAGLRKHLIGLAVDAGRSAIVSRAQRAVSSTAYGLRCHRSERNTLVLLVVSHVAARLSRQTTEPAVSPMMHPRRLRHLVSVSPGEHAVRHGQLDGVGVGARHKIIVVRTQRMAVCGSHGHHLGGLFLELAVDCAPARLLRPAATPAANPQVGPLHFHHLAPELVETQESPLRAMSLSVGTPRSLAGG
ncbi:hypothetical protein V5799_019281 [Amblyomma americanum]|uniref:Uncharacterized protein n=1 Tax=Amblyomma americanum TaxID=6943 RepID=A0AAQ4EXR8_AMBAM